MKLSMLMQAPRQAALADGMLRIFATFRLNQAIIQNVQQLIHLLADIQRHRACSLGILSGNAGFELQAGMLNRKIHARLDYLDSQQEMAEIIDQREWQNILAEWQVVGYGWRQDSVLHNFELHSHLLEKVLHIVRAAGRWVLRSGVYSENSANQQIGHAVFDFFFAYHLYQIETLGRLRGLGTHVANSGCRDEPMRLRVEYLLQCVRQEQQMAQEFFSSQPAAMLKEIPALLDIYRLQPALQEWYEQLEQLLSQRIAHSDEAAASLYRLATTVIDVRLSLTEPVLAHLQLTIENMLEQRLDEAAGVQR